MPSKSTGTSNEVEQKLNSKVEEKTAYLPLISSSLLLILLLYLTQCLSDSVTQSLSQSRLQKKTTMQSYLSSPTPLLSCTSRLQHPLPSFTTTIHTKPFLHVLFFDSILRLSSSNSLSHTESQKRHPLYICLLLRLTH